MINNTGKSILILPLFTLLLLAGCGGKQQKPVTPEPEEKRNMMLADMPIDSDIKSRELVFADDMDAFIIEDNPRENPLRSDPLTQIAYNQQEIDFEPINKDGKTGVVYFAYDARKPASGQQENLATVDDLAQTIYKQGNVVCIKGHACKWHGTAAYNVALSQDRSLFVKDHLMKDLNIPETHIKAFGVGNEEPVSFDWSLEGQAPNRRVEVYALTA